jgi:GTP cyclohydrolase II
MPMDLRLTPAELVNRARADLRLGVPVALRDGGSRALVLAAEVASRDRLAQMQALGPDLTLAITRHRADTLKARAYDGDVARVLVPADANLAWVRALADPADDLRHPMKGPLRTDRDSPADIHRAAIALAKSAQLLPAVLVVGVPDTLSTADLTEVPVALMRAELARESVLAPVISARLPMAAAQGGARACVSPRRWRREHYAIEMGAPDRAKPVLARLHSACFTGDVLGSLKCDCGPQLNAALTRMGPKGRGCCCI